MDIPSRGAVVVTGASTGIGRACVLMLDQLRLRIFGLPTAFGVLDTALAPDRTLKV